MKELIEELRYLAGVIGDADGAMLCQAADAIESQAATIARYETTAENHELSRAKVDEQALEIERITRAYTSELDELAQRNYNMRFELAALKAQPSGVVLPERAIAGNDQAYMYVYGRNHAIEEMARLNPSPASAGDDESRHETVKALHDVMQAVPCASLYSLAEAVLDAGYMKPVSAAAPSATLAPGECVAVPLNLEEFAKRAAVEMEKHDFHGFEPVVLAVVSDLLAQHGKAVGDE